MSIKSKLLASAATLTLVSGVGVAGLATAGAANAATPSCGDTCIDIFSHDFGTFHQPNFVLDVYKQGQNVGQPIILFRTSNSDAAEDFTISEQGLVSDFFAAGLVSAAVDLHYGGGALTGLTYTSGPNKGKPIPFPDFKAYEIEYAPFGADTGLCVGVGATAVAGTKIALEPCGVSSKTVWVEDFLDTAVQHTASIPLINGSDTNFSHPFVMTYPSSGYPTDKPRPQLYTSNLTGFSGNVNGVALPELGTVASSQLFNVWKYGVLG